ncbi:MAG: hypothetical protein Tsb0013_03460 [Phycisphaerales bacterium]
MDWNDATERGQRIWVNVRERTARVDPRAAAPLHVRLMRLLITAFVLGLVAILGVLAIGVGLVVLAIVAVVLLVRRAWRALVGGFAIGGHGGAGRRNVRVIDHTSGPR